MIHVKNINLSFGNQTIFDNVSFTIQQNQKIGLVGANGSGKSTLLKAIADMQNLDSGTIAVENRSAIAYMPQEVVLESEKSVYLEALSTFELLHKLQMESKQLEQQLESSTEQTIIERYAQIHQELEHHDPHKAASETERILTGLGFSEEQKKQPVKQLSVGWKMRLILAKLLLKKANFYLFDEPTNHLDIVAKDWFLNFLKESSSGFLLVCHDRYFLDQLCSEIISLERGKAKRYRGNYSSYEQQRENELATLQSAHDQQQREIKQKKRTIDRFRAKSSKAKMAKSMQKELDKIELITLPPSLKNVNFSFPEVQRAGRIVLRVKNVAHSFGEKKIFKNVTFDIERGQKVAIVAPNGTGKSTLLNLICKQLPLKTGTIEFGYNVKHALFAQDQNRSLNLDETILQNVQSCCTNKSEKIIRSFLGSFLFSGDDVDKKTKVLSGGEKNRVSMACVLLQDANFLLLDEPTNHLDIQSKEVLLKALNAYHGTVLFVSHDRDFVNRVSDHIIDLTPNGAHKYQGDYESYLYQKQHNQKAESFSEKSNEAKNKNVSKKQKYEQRKKDKKLENKINKLEKEIKKLELKFADLEYGTQEFEQNQQQLLEKKQELDSCYEEWETTLNKA